MPLSADQITSHFKKLCEEIFNERRYERLQDFYASDLISYSLNGHPDLPPIEGLEGLEKTIDALHAAFPGIRHEIDDVVAQPYTWTRDGVTYEGYKAALRYHADYKHTGTALSIKPEKEGNIRLA